MRLHQIKVLHDGTLVDGAVRKAGEIVEVTVAKGFDAVSNAQAEWVAPGMRDAQHVFDQRKRLPDHEVVEAIGDLLKAQPAAEEPKEDEPASKPVKKSPYK